MIYIVEHNWIDVKNVIFLQNTSFSSFACFLQKESKTVMILEFNDLGMNRLALISSLTEMDRIEKKKLFFSQSALLQDFSKVRMLLY